jgi:hypothetical protein
MAVVVASLVLVPTASAQEQPQPPEFNAEGTVPGSSTASPTKLPDRSRSRAPAAGRREHELAAVSATDYCRVSVQSF